jgi:hypothetical protein
MNEVSTKLEDLVNRHRAVRAVRAELSAEDKKLGAEQKSIEGELIREMREMGVDGLRVAGASLGVTSKPSTKVDDIDTFARWCVENGQTHLLYKSAIPKEVERMIIEGRAPKGVTLSHYDSISIRNNA